MKTRCRGTAVLISFLVAPVGVAADDTIVTHFTDDTGDRMPLQTMVPVYPERALAERVEGEVKSAVR